MARRPPKTPTPGAGAGPSRGRQRPDGEARRSQLLTGYGPGALVDLVRDAVVVGGLDQWRYPNDLSGFLSEPRLQAALLPLLRAQGRTDLHAVRLRQPPDCDDEQPRPDIGIGTRRFPGWFVCQNDRCHSLVDRRGLDDKGRHRCEANSRHGAPVVPVRFIKGCPAGHLDDLDWHGWIHRWARAPGLNPTQVGFDVYCVPGTGSQKPNDPLGAGYQSPLYLHMTGTSSELADQVAGCRHCGTTRNLMELAQKQSLGPCRGRRPWLKDREPCPEPRLAKMLTRTAGNVYFPLTRSVLVIPDPSLGLTEAVERAWPFLEGVDDLETLRQRLNIPMARKALADDQGHLPDEHLLLDAVRVRAAGQVPTMLRLRHTEWLAFKQAPVERPGERPGKDVRWFARKAAVQNLPPFIERVVVAHNVTEVVAQYAFTRVDGPTPDAEGDVTLEGLRPAPLGVAEDWVPAVEIHGEGLFIAFDLPSIRAWEARPAVQAVETRFREAFRRYNLQQRSAIRQVAFPGVRLVMLHSLAHLLMQAIALDAGYPVSALRERLYCHHSDHPGDERAGIFIHTGSPGTEGTLGGLIEAARHLDRHLRRAVELATLCSNDPVCAQHEPDQHEEDRLRHGAACHACLLISEPSCERMNRDLDRTLVVPTLHDAGAAFLGDWIASWT